MALFEACSKQFVKDTGRSTLRPVLDLNTSSRCNILCVVTKKRSRWFWKSIKYKTTPFRLNEILTKPIDVKGKVEKSTFIENYKNEPKFHVSGKLGAKIATEFGIDLSATDSFTINMDVGTVTKRQIRWEDLNDALADMTLNLDHEYVQYILSKPRRSLCVIYETVATHGVTEFDSDSSEKGDGSINAGKPKFSINLSGSVEVAHHRSFELPDNTIIGYACYEVTFDPALGTFELVLADVTDAGAKSIKEHCVFDEPDGQKDRALRAVFDELFNSPLRSKIFDHFRKILSYPATIAPLRDLLEKGLSAAEKKSPKPVSLKDFKARADTGYDNCKELLLLIGFNFEESGDSNITFPQDGADRLLRCCTALAEALVELSAPQCRALKDVTSEYLEPLLYLLKNAMYGKNTSVDDPLLQRVWTHSSNPAKELLQSLGFDQVTTEGNQKVLSMRLDSEQISLEDVYVAVFVLCAK